MSQSQLCLCIDDLDRPKHPGVRLTLFKDEKAITGVPLDLGQRLLSFAFEDVEDKADKLTLDLDNHDLALFDREELMGGAILEVA